MNKKSPFFFFLAVVVVCGLVWTGMPKKEEKKEQNRYTATFFEIFDTRTEIVGYGNTEEEFKAQAELIKEKLTYYNNLFDIYNDYEGTNNIKTINDYAGRSPVVVNEEIIELLQFCKEMYEQSDGQVNAAMGSVLSIWHEHREEGRDNPERASVPEMSELKNAEKYTDISHLIIDEEAGTVYLDDSNVSLDVGGIGKGYAVQKVADYAKKELKIESLLLSVGGNVCAIGGKENGQPWKVGIQNPDMESAERYKAKAEVRDRSVVTSGDYQRYYMVDDVRYCHIIDPDTLMPADYFASVTIISKDSGYADAMSTAVYNMTLEEGLKFVDNMDEIEAIWIMKDGSIHYSQNAKEYLGR